MEAQHIYHAIEALRNELIVRDDARKESIDGILEHLRTLNGRTRKSENSIARLNLVVFGIGGTVATALLGVVLKYFG